MVEQEERDNKQEIYYRKRFEYNNEALDFLMKRKGWLANELRIVDHQITVLNHENQQLMLSLQGMAGQVRPRTPKIK